MNTPSNSTLAHIQKALILHLTEIGCLETQTSKLLGVSRSTVTRYKYPGIPQVTKTKNKQSDLTKADRRTLIWNFFRWSGTQLHFVTYHAAKLNISVELLFKWYLCPTNGPAAYRIASCDTCHRPMPLLKTERQGRCHAACTKTTISASRA